MRPADLPPADRFAHGTRARYVAARCRCEPCTTANRLYQRTRALAKVRGQWNGLVSAEPSRAHLLSLRRAGIGKRSVAAASDVPTSIVYGIANGTREHVRAATERKLLAVTTAARADASTVPAGPTWAAIARLRKMGWTKGAISQALGNKTPALQLRRDRVLACTALKVARLLKLEKAKTARCVRCGELHTEDPTAAAWCAENPTAPLEPLEMRRGAA